MGDFRITIDGVGNHGCGRGTEGVGADGKMRPQRCRSLNCVDCLAADFAAHMQARGAATVNRVMLEHWPAMQLQMGYSEGLGIPIAGELKERGGEAGPVDDLLNGSRSKPF